MENQQRTASIKRKRTSGYAVFCSEYRRKCQAETPHLQFSEISKKVSYFVLLVNTLWSTQSRDQVQVLLTPALLILALRAGVSNTWT